MQTFSTLMQEWLYGDQGYYRTAKIGTQGDFYTSVNASRCFGGTLAFYLLSLLEQGVLDLPLSVVEIGAGEGYLLQDVVLFLRDLSCGVLEHTAFLSVEPLNALATLQQQRLQKIQTNLIGVPSLEALRPHLRKSTFVYCNELWDSFPCQVCQDSQMLYVDSFKPIWRPLSQEVLDFLSHTHPPEKIAHFKGCVPLTWEDYVKDLIPSLQQSQKWVLVGFDYGQYGARGGVDLRAYTQHRVLDFADILANLEGYYQQVDLTYDIDFQLLETLFHKQGAHTLFYGTQSAALIKMGLTRLLELLEQNTPFTLYSKEALKARSLISPEGFGERFKGLILGSHSKSPKITNDSTELYQ
ncbi:SAM-dependent methyltransferase [Helicobacter mehlei]|uniref:SAM-dependent methyltransferase n=1 Tax=Helicobacter mehlei TaxID=2316080 RepID=A0A553V0N6_9HELI|nr:SAM-dependent methyltransferase [Helicobacter mehlei]TSA86027.1 hypothetical protein FNE76_02785 [Helicobacter mehlei]